MARFVPRLTSKISAEDQFRSIIYLWLIIGVSPQSAPKVIGKANVGIRWPIGKRITGAQAGNSQ